MTFGEKNAFGFNTFQMEAIDILLSLHKITTRAILWGKLKQILHI